MILVYTGSGKGKTSACLGQVTRALGHGLRVGFAQFMKQDDKAGEQRLLRQLLGNSFLAGGAGFFRNEEDRPLHRLAAQNTLAWAKEQMPGLDMLILDESLYALGNGLLTLGEIKDLCERSQQDNCHLVLSGRGFPDELTPYADMITEMREVKHPWHKGEKAMMGVDY